MNESENTIESLFQKIEEHTNTHIGLFKLKSIQQLSKIIPNLLFGILVLALLFFMLVTLTISAAIFLGKLTGQNYYGYLIVAAVYIFILSIMYSMQKHIKLHLKNKIIRYLLK
jgi:hypothetical protein